MPKATSTELALQNEVRQLRERIAELEKERLVSQEARYSTEGKTAVGTLRTVNDEPDRQARENLVQQPAEKAWRESSEESLRRLNSELEDRVAERTAELAAAADKVRDPRPARRRALMRHLPDTKIVSATQILELCWSLSPCFAPLAGRRLRRPLGADQEV